MKTEKPAPTDASESYVTGNDYGMQPRLDGWRQQADREHFHV
jgi:hypothetical protein